MPGLINVDFADVRTIMQNAGTSLMGIGTGVGENRAQTAARSAISSPLLEITMEGARGVLFNVIGGNDLTMSEVDDAAKIIAQAADSDANIIFGATIDETMKDQIKITVIATGFDGTRQTLREFVTPQRFGSSPAIVSQEEKSEGEESNYQDEEPPPPSSPPSTDEEEDVWDIPAFLRQKN